MVVPQSSRTEAPIFLLNHLSQWRFSSMIQDGCRNTAAINVDITFKSQRCTHPSRVMSSRRLFQKLQGTPLHTHTAYGQNLFTWPSLAGKEATLNSISFLVLGQKGEWRLAGKLGVSSAVGVRVNFVVDVTEGRKEQADRWTSE